MPIAKDDGATSVDSDVTKTIRELAAAAAPSPVRQVASAAGGSADYAVHSALKGEKREGPLFNPTAEISAGLVREAANQFIPQQMWSPLEVKEQGRQREDSVLPLIGMPRTSDRGSYGDEPGEAMRKPDEKSFRPESDRIYGNEPGEPLRSPRQAKIVREVMNEIAMKSGALTTVPEVDEAGAADDDRMRELEAGSLGMDFDESRKYRNSHGANIPDRVSPVDDEAIEEAMNRAAQRAQEKGLDDQGRNRPVQEMTLERYNALNPQQRAAVDINTMLVEAVQRDLGRNVDSKKQFGAKYQEKLRSTLGEYEDGFAPATVKVLDRIGFKDSSVSLDDVLKLKIAFSPSDLKDLEPDKGGPDASLATPEKQREALQAGLVENVLATRKDPDRGSALRETSRDLLDLESMPGFGPAVPIEQGGTPEQARNHLFQMGLQALSDQANAKAHDQILAMVKSSLAEPDVEWPMFVAFLNAATRESQQYNLPLGQNPEVDYLRPGKLRRTLL